MNIIWKYSFNVYVVLNLITTFAVAFSTPIKNDGASASASDSIISNSKVRCVDCAIIGGGPAGLSAALTISKSAPSKTIAIFERDSFQPKGASIAISKSGWKSIKEMDPMLVKQIKKTSAPVNSVEIKPWHTEDTEKKSKRERIFKVGLTIISFFLRLFKGAVNYTHLWHDVRTVLAGRAKEVYQHAKDDGADLLNLNCSLENVQPLDTSDEENQQGARFEITVNENGRPKIIHAKILIACDGSMSKVRAILPNEPDILIDERKSVWRGITPTSTNGKATFYADKQTGRSALVFPAGKDAGASWTVISPIQAGKSETDAEARSRLAKVIDDLGDEEFKKAVDDSPIIIENKLQVRDFDKPWKSSYDGLAYAGDAAHPVRPTGEGTALAFEDAKVLGEVVAKYGLSVEALRAYEDMRYEPVKRISDEVRRLAKASYAQLDKTNKSSTALTSDITAYGMVDDVS